MRALPGEARPNVLRFARNWSLAKPEEFLAAFPEIESPEQSRRRALIVPNLEDLTFDQPELQARLERVLAPRREGRKGPPEA